MQAFFQKFFRRVGEVAWAKAFSPRGRTEPKNQAAFPESSFSAATENCHPGFAPPATWPRQLAAPQAVFRRVGTVGWEKAFSPRGGAPSPMNQLPLSPSGLRRDGILPIIHCFPRDAGAAACRRTASGDSVAWSLWVGRKRFLRGGRLVQ